MRDTTFFKKNYTREYRENGRKCRIVIEADLTSLGKQHPYFSLTADLYEQNPGNHHWYLQSCGMLHDEIKKHVPSLAKYLPFHLVSVDGPMYYIENSLYWAGLCGWTDGKKDSPPNLEHLKSTCLWEGDDTPLRTLLGKGDKNSTLNKVKAKRLTELLQNRHDSVMARFFDAMAELFGEEVRTLPQIWEAAVNK